MYVESTQEGTFLQQGDETYLLSPNEKHSGNYCLQFFYHMRGRDTDILRIYKKVGNVYKALGKLNTILKEDVWRKAEFNIKGEFDQIAFHYVRGLDYRNDPAIDDVYLYPGKCSSKTIYTIRNSFRNSKEYF